MARNVAQELTTRQIAFLTALFGAAEGDPLVAAKIAGYPDNADLNAITKPLRDTILDMAETHLSMSAAKASMVITKQMVDPDPMAKEKMAAAMQILDRVGVAKTEREHTTKGKKNYVFLIPAKRIEGSNGTALEFKEAVPLDATYEEIPEDDDT